MAEPYDSYDYPRYWIGREYEDQAEKLALKKFFAKIPQKNSLIDIGGGFGRHASIYAPIFQKCLLVDPSEKLLNYAQKGLKRFKNIEFKKGTGESLPVGDAGFDVALMIRVIHHLPNPYPAFLEVHRVLKPSGFFILEFANKIHFRACLRAWLKGNLGFTGNLQPVDQRSAQPIARGTLPFLNHHPRFISEELQKAGFEIIWCLSVSNFRHSILKKLIPLSLLLFLESSVQRAASSVYFGPSIFFLAQKT